MTGTMLRLNIEHANGFRSDNRWSNLREGNRSQKRGHRLALAEPRKVMGVWQVGDHFDAMIDVQGLCYLRHDGCTVISALAREMVP